MRNWTKAGLFRSVVAVTVLAGPMGVGICQAQQHKAVTVAVHDFALTFKVSGKVAKLPVKEGDRVEAGQLLMELEDREGEAAIVIYKRKAESDVAIREAKAESELADVDVKRLDYLLSQAAANPLELEKARVTAKIASLKIEDALEQREENKNSYEAAVAKHDQSVLRAPSAGVIQYVAVEVGETVEQLKTVVRLVVTNTLHVETPVPVDQTMKMKVGDPAWVRYELPNFEKPVEGKIVFLAPAAEAMTGDRRVKVEVRNDFGLPPGIGVRVSFGPPGNANAVEGAQGAANVQARPAGVAAPAPRGDRS